MSTLFFDHLINISKLQEQIRNLSATEHELRKIEDQVDALIQHRVVEVILDLLHAEHHHTFVTYLEEKPGNPEVLLWLKEHIEDVEQTIKKTIDELEQELIDELLS